MFRIALRRLARRTVSAEGLEERLPFAHNFKKRPECCNCLGTFLQIEVTEVVERTLVLEAHQHGLLPPLWVPGRVWHPAAPPELLLEALWSPGRCLLDGSLTLLTDPAGEE